MFYYCNNLLFDVNSDSHSKRHSRISDKEFTIETIQTENWQYFIERILEACQSNRIGDNIDQSGIQESQLVQRYIKNLAICKQVYQEFYSKIAQYFAAMLKILPSTMIRRIGDDLRNHYFFIDFNKKIDSIEYLNVFCEFYHKYGRFPGADNLTVLPRPQIPHFLNGDEMISPRGLFERFQWTDARGLVSVQALAAIAVYLGQHVSDEIAEGVMSEILHNLSHQVLDGKKYNNFTSI